MYYKIYENSTLINTIVADEEFVSRYCEKHGYTYEPEEREEPEPAEESTFDAATLAKAITEGVNEV